MYNEERNGFSIRDFVIQCLFIIIFILILIWLFPTKADIKKLVGEASGNDALLNQIYSDNLGKMKDAAVSYYTTTRLPKNINEKSSMTLAQMLDKKLLVAPIDSANKQCNIETSYVEITKLEDEYELKVQLNCSDVQDYIIVHLGCYDYCNGNVCEKQEQTKPTTPVKACTKTCGKGYTLINPNSSNCYCKKNTTPVKTCQITSCDAGYTLVNPNSSNCYCKKNEEKPKTCPITTCPTGSTLVNPNSSDCYCKKNEEQPKTCPITTCPTGSTLVNPNSSDCYCKQNEVKIYNYYKDVDKSYWTSWSNWTTEYKEITSTLQRQEKTYITVAKLTKVPTYEYQYSRSVQTSAGSSSYQCGAWSYTYVTYTGTRALNTTYTSNGVETVPVRLNAILSKGECGACTASKNYQYYVKQRTCRTVTTAPTYQTEYNWFATNPGGNWSYTGNQRQSGTIDQYSDSKWVLETEIPAGYVRYGTNTTKYYSYKEYIRKTERIYTTSNNPNLGNGWIRY